MTEKFRFEQRLLGIYLAAALLILLLAAAAWLTSINAVKQTHAVDDTYAVLGAIAKVESGTLLIETLTRGYLISGNAANLEQRKVAGTAREAHLRRLKELVDDDPAQQQRWLKLREVVDERRAIAQRSSQLRQTEGFEAARDFSSSAPVMETRERMFGLVRAMEEDELRQLRERNEALAQARRIEAAVGVLATVALILLLAFSFAMIRRQMRETEASRRAEAEAAARVAAILAAVADGIITIDARGTVESINPAAERIFGYAAGEVVGRNVNMLMPEPYQSEHDGYIERYQRTGEARVIGSGREVEGRRKDGGIFPLELAVTRMAPDGATRFIGVVRDITERRRAQQELTAARDEAVRANRAKSEFLSSMSHELRTPMNAILGFSQLMEIDETLSDDNKESVHEILKAGKHLLELINDVLNLARIEADHIDLSLEPLAAGPLIEECVALMRPVADKRGIRVELANADGANGAMVRADRTRLKQALLNLMSNAVKYNREGGSVRIEMQARGEDRWRILVADSGPGISAGRMAELFQPFNRLGAENGTIEGTGIGLVITRRIVELMGGTVDVASTAGEGSTFWIELPMAEAPAPAAASENGKVGAGETALAVAEAGRFTVLYVEDNPANLKLVAQILGQRKHIRLLTSHAPELGIELARTRHPDLILLDINLPDMDGYQVLEVFKTAPELKDIPVVAVTANAMASDIERGLARGFADYITKPIDVAKFLATVDRFLMR